MTPGQPRDETDEILGRELAKLGSVAGAVGGAVGGGAAGAVGGGIGGARGPGWAMRYLSSEVYEASVEFAGDPADTVTRCYETLTELGEPTASEEAVDHPRLQAVIGSGFMRLNPAVVEIDVKPTGSAASQVSVRASAKEGLIKQHTAEKAVRRVVEALEG